ncbi:hypothetical protein Poly51_47840 [Rubripirellula tenax]|uniref:Glutamine amidotransferase type-2 domain-containing protein n=1 Tax=Rubripirellula tenax TaxID=2528015 RepID=A0A5C6EK53_9BACT|nr:class II glutamine amidotransferase [Rubripirellula tenax]TWU48880.1 hypothetical protein Poly51_47840 [Rubripirellula tenax]
MTARDHSDGWGVVSYHRPKIKWLRRAVAAYDDDRFAQPIDASFAKTVVASIRRASRSAFNDENCHPFMFGRWSFAHNGTLTAVETLRPAMLREMGPEFRKQIRGQTDIELIFCWLLQRLQANKCINGDRCVRLAGMLSTFADAVSELDARNRETESASDTDRTAKLNFVLTNGNVLVGSRLRNSLYRLSTQHDRPTGRPLVNLAIASEPTDSRR